MRGLGVIVMVAACGDNLDDPFAARSGERLKLHYSQYDDGTLQLEREHGFYDAVRGEDCWPMRFADGFSYCVPIDPRNTIPNTLYTSSDCTSRLVESDANVEYGVHGVWIIDRFVPSTVVQLGSSTLRPTSRFELRNGGCHGPLPVVGDRSYYEIADEITRDRFVTIAAETLPVLPDLDVVLESSPDGLHAPRGFSAHGVPCELVPVGDDRSRECRPVEVVEATLFHGPDCTQRVLVLPATQPMPDLALVRDDLGCARYHRVRRPTFGPLYKRTGGDCFRADDLEPDEREYLLDEPTELPSVELHEQVGGRLHRLSIGDTGIASGELFDSQLQTSCTMHELGETPIRCLPRLAPYQELFEDERCTRTLVSAVPRRRCDPGYRFAAMYTNEHFTVHEVADEIASAFHISSRGGNECLLYVQPPAVELHRLGDAIPFTEFVGGSIVRER